LPGYRSGLKRELISAEFKLKWKTLRFSPSEDNIYKIELVFEKLALNPGEFVAIAALVDKGEFIARVKYPELSVFKRNISFGLLDLPHKWIINGKTQ
jgi:hypothetical protein